MYDICNSDEYGSENPLWNSIESDRNISNKFNISYTYDNSFKMYDVSISRK